MPSQSHYRSNLALWEKAPYEPLPRDFATGRQSRTESSDSSLPETCSRSAAGFWIDRMMENYITAPKLSEEEADSYVVKVAQVLMHYPESIAQRVADPFRGIAAESKWHPNL